MYGADINSLAVLKRVSDILKYSKECRESSFARLASISSYEINTAIGDFL